MHKQPDKPSFFEKLATAIVDRRNLIFFLYLCALIFSLFSQGWVKVCNDLTQYLPENTETRQGLTIMEDEFITYGTARIMLSNVTYDMAANLAAELASIGRRNLRLLWQRNRAGHPRRDCRIFQRLGRPPLRYL